VVLYLMEEKDMTAKAISDLLWHASGLLGVSGISNDMRTLLASADPHAKEGYEAKVLENRAEGAERYAEASIEVALAAIDDAEHATLEALLARQDANTAEVK